MLGHKVWQVCRTRFDCYTTVRDAAAPPATGLFDADRTITGVDAGAIDSVARAVERARPTVIVNCVGVVKQAEAAADAARTIQVNALFPHQVARLAAHAGARFIHISTDCVFRGDRGRYTEDEPADADDVYGRSKRLGEVTSAGALTLRTSIVGRELRGAHGVLEWFLSQRGGTARGFSRAVFSGLTTTTLARTIADVIESHPALSGTWHVAAAPISKLDLLRLFDDAFDAKVTIVPTNEPVIDRSLDGRRFREATGWAAPAWPEMVASLAADDSPYEAWRAAC